MFANKDSEEFDISSNFTHDDINVKAEVLSDDDSSGIVYGGSIENPQNYLEISQKEDNDVETNFSEQINQIEKSAQKNQQIQQFGNKPVLPYIPSAVGDGENRDILSREQVEGLLRDGHPDLVCERPLNSRHSSTWDRFQIVYYRNIRQNFAKCIDCNYIVSYKKTTGTASLIRHKCKIRKPMEAKSDSLVELLLLKNTPAPTSTTSSTTLRMGPSPSSSVSAEPKPSCSNKAYTETLHSELIRKFLLFVSKGLYTSDLCTDQNFLELAQILIKIGAECGNQKVSSLINKDQIYDEVLPTFFVHTKNSLKDSLDHTKYSISYEKCADKNENIYLIVFSYYLDENFEYCHSILATRGIEGYAGQAESKIIKSICAEYGEINGKLNCIQSGKSDETFESFPCIVNVISDIISDSFAVHSTFFEALYNEISQKIEINKSYKDASTLEKLKVFYVYYSYSKEIQENESTISRNFKNVFGLLLSAITSIRNNQKVTTNEVFLWIKKFQKFYSTPFGDDENMNSIKARLYQSINKNIHHFNKELYQIAVFLDPNFKSLKFLDPSEKSKLLDIVKRKLETIIDNSIDSPGPSKKLKTSNNESEADSCVASDFLEFMDITMEDSSDIATSEIQRYMGFKLEKSTDIMEFWRSANNFPYLKILAKNTLNLPGCSFYGKCCFVTHENPFYDRCKFLNSNEIEHLTFLYQNL